MCLVDWLREAVMDEIPGWADSGGETQTDNNQHDAQHILIITSQACQAGDSAMTSSWSCSCSDLTTGS